jgi:hypothetical protein
LLYTAKPIISSPNFGIINLILRLSLVLLAAMQVGSVIDRAYSKLPLNRPVLANNLLETRDTQIHAKLEGGAKPLVSANSVLNISESNATPVRKALFSADYNHTSYAGKSDQLNSLYEQLKVDGKVADSAEIKVSVHGQEKSLIVSANSVVLPNGETYSLKDKSDIKKALKNNEIDFNGSLKIEVKSSREYKYTDDKGEEQTQQGFSIISFSYTDELGQEQTGEFAINDDLYEGSTSTAADATVVEQNFSTTDDTEIDAKFIYQSDFKLEKVNVLDIQQNQRDLEAYLKIVKSVTTGEEHKPGEQVTIKLSLDA